MKKLVLVRHGAYGYDDRLSEQGKIQMVEIARQLQSTIKDTNVCVLSSCAERATDSAEVIITELNIPSFKVNDLLLSDNRHPEDLKAASDLIQEHSEFDVLILITHLEYVERLPQYFGLYVLGKILDNVPSSVEKGQAVVIDCETFSAELLNGF